MPFHACLPSDPFLMFPALHCRGAHSYRLFPRLQCKADSGCVLLMGDTWGTLEGRRVKPGISPLSLPLAFLLWFQLEHLPDFPAVVPAFIDNAPGVFKYFLQLLSYHLKEWEWLPTLSLLSHLPLNSSTTYITSALH